MLADRFNIYHIRDRGEIPPSPIALSAQVIVDCSHGMFNFGCNGGDPYAAIEYIFENGVPHVSCQQYAARNNVENPNKCSDYYICRDCTPPIPTKIGE